MRVDELIELMKWNAKCDAYEGYCQNPNVLTWVGIREVDYYISIPTGIKQDSLDVYIRRMNRDMYKVSMGISASQGKYALITEKEYKLQNEIDEIQQYPGVQTIMENLATMIEENKGKREEIEKMSKKNNLVEADMILKNYS